MSGFISFFISWLLIVVLLVFMANTSWGKPILSYTLWLMVLLLLIVSGPSIANMLSQSGVESA